MLPTVPLDLAQAELEKVLDSPSFRRSPKLSGFLRYVARHTFDGNDDAIKEYNIGVEVFERGSNFDPRIDNIVRSQAHRLRVSLAAYYAGEGQQDPVRIEIVPGSYVPRFHTPEAVEESRPAVESPNWPKRAVWVLSGALLLAATLWLSRSTSSVRPVELLEFAIVLPDTLRLDLDAGIGTLAPDSRSIVIPAVDRQGVRRLWLRALDSSALRALPGTEDASFPFWSPDGRQIAFFSQRRLKRIRVSDGNVQVICDAPLARGGSWGSQNIILFAASTSGPLLRVPAEGGEVRPVGSLDTGRREFVHRWPTFLPDGYRFLYYSGAEQPGASGIWLRNLDAGPPRQLAGTDAISSPSLALDDWGRNARLLYISRGALLAQSFDLSSANITGKPAELASGLPFPSSTGSPFHAVSDRALVFFKGVANQTSPVVLARDGRVLANPAGPGDFGDLQLSPDGRYFAFERRDPTLGKSDIFLHDLERQAVVRLSNEPANNLNPAWFPDSGRLIFSIAEKSHPGMRTFDLRNGRAGEFIPGSRGGDFPQQVTRDERHLLTLHAAESSGFDVWMLELASQQRVPIAVEPGNQRQARLSGDEKLIAYTSDDSGRDEIYVKSWDGERVSDRRWTVSIDGGAFPLWQSRNGYELSYLAPNGMMMSVRLEVGEQGLKAAKPLPLFEAKAFSYSAVRYPYSIFPDGRFLVNRFVDQPGSPITIRLNWAAAGR
jgi:eukaryotic-like serine/threonine-protein kinase